MQGESAEARARLAERVRRLRDAGELTRAIVREVAAAAGVTQRTVWRWATNGWPAGRPGPVGWTVGEADLDALHAAGGNVAAAWRARRAAGAELPGLRAYQKALARQVRPIDRAAAADGLEGQRRHQVYVRWEAEHRNQRWEADHFQLDVLVLPPRVRRPVRPWLTVFVDAYSRLVMGWALAVAPSAATVLAALRHGLVVDADRGPFGGLPGCLRPDRGLEFAATALRQAAAALGITLLPAPPYSPHLKGKVERFGGTLAGELRVLLPAASTAAADGQAVPVTLGGLAGGLAELVAAYNTTRPHEGLGGATPLARWQADPTPVRQVDPAEVRWLLLGGEQRTITKHGIRFGGLRYLAPELNGRVGQQVEVRFMPHDHRQLEVYLDGTWLCTALPTDLLGPVEREAVLARRRDDAAELARRRRRVRRAARARLAPLTGPGEPEDVTVIGRERAAGERRRRDDAALARLARTDLLGLEEIGRQIEARNQTTRAAWPTASASELPDAPDHDHTGKEPP